jgi:G8 domain
MKKIYLLFTLFSLFTFTQMVLGNSITTAGSGSWSSVTPNAPWPGGTPPSSGDDVVIKDGTTLTIDQSPTVASITVGQGTSGILTFQNTTTARTLTVSGTVTVANGGTLQCGTQSNSPAAHQLSIGGNLSIGNSSTFNMVAPTSPTVRNVTVSFVSTNDADVTISSGGTPTSVVFYSIILNRGTSARKVVCSLTASSAMANAITFTNGTWEQSGGTLTFSSSTAWTFPSTGNFTISGSGSVTFGSPVVISAGTFLMNTSGIVNVGGSGTRLEPAGGTITLTAGTINVGGRIGSTTNPGQNNWTGTLTINGATVNVPSNALSNGSNGVIGAPASGGTFTMSSGTLNILTANQGTYAGNDIDFLSGTISGGTIVIGSASPGTQAFNVNITPTANNITCYTGTNTANLISDLNIAGTLTLTSGNIALAGKTLTLGTSTVVPGTLTYTAGFMTGSGTFKRWFGTAAIADGTFPMGVGSNNRFLAIGGTPSTGGTVSVSYTDASTVSQPFGSGFIENGQTFVNRYDAVWTVSDANSFAGTGLTLAINGNGIPGITAIADLNVSGATGPAPGTYAATTGNTSAPIVNRGGLTEGTLPSTYYYASTSNSPLPVELSSFVSNVQGRNILLNWSTQTEKNSDKFVVEKKTIGTNWEAIGSVKAAVLSNSPKQYSFTDKNLNSGLYQYRLKMIDNDGSFQFSKIVETDVTLPKDFDLSQNYPNPFNPSTKINYNLPYDSKVTLDIYNILGVKVGQLVNQDQSAGYYNVEFSTSSLNKSISSGVYLYKITALDKATGNSFSAIKKMIMLK